MIPGRHRGYVPGTSGQYGPPRPFKPLYRAMSEESLIWAEFTDSPAVKVTPNFFAVVAGAGAATLLPVGLDLTDHPGVWRLVTGTAVDGRVFILTEAAALAGSHHVGVGGVTRVGTWIKTGPGLSVGLERYVLRAGQVSISVPNPFPIVEGIAFEYVDNENGGRWQAITHDGVETSTDTGITVTTDTWYKLEHEVNSDGTSVDFFIDDVLVATNTTNIPAGTGFSLFYSAHIIKTIGIASRELFIDAAYVYQRITR